MATDPRAQLYLEHQEHEVAIEVGIYTVASFALWSLLESNRPPSPPLDPDLEGFFPALGPSDAAPPFRSIHC